MDQEPEKTKSERRVTWEIVNPDQLRIILANTLQETIFQNVAAANVYAQLISKPADEGKREVLEAVMKTTNDAVGQLRALEKLLRQEPSESIPIDHRYGDMKIVALDQVGKPPA